MSYGRGSHRTLLAFIACGLAASASLLPAQQRGGDAHPTLTVGTATAKRGEKATGVIAVPAGADPALDIPVAVVHGARPGPVLALVAGAHGTEYASIVALQRLVQDLAAARVSGSVIIVPLVNVPSFEKIVPHLNPVDGKNMNRFYPGKPDGTQTERASWAITRQVVEQADHLIDMHGGDLDESLRPYSYWTVTGNAKQDSISRQMVLAFGLDHIIVSRDRPTDPAASRYLENTATTRGKPSFTAEAGYAGTVTPADVEALVNGSLNVMAYLRMIDRRYTAVSRPVWLTELLTVTAGTAGVFHPLVRRGQRVTKGVPLGEVTDYLGRRIEQVAAPGDGLVLYVRAVPSLSKGETIASIGRPGRP